MADTTQTNPPSGNWLDQILKGASDLGDKWLTLEMFNGLLESKAADQADNPYPYGYGPYPEGYSYGYTDPTKKDNTMMLVLVGVSVLGLILMMKK